jgi:hypothetical protein
MDNYSFNKVQALYKFGKADIDQTWPNYIEELSLTKDDVSELIRIIKSSNLKNISPLSLIEEFAPMHAWRALGQLKVLDTIRILLEILTEEKNEEAFWFQAELPKIIGYFGIGAISIIVEFLSQTSDWVNKSIVLEGLKNIALNNIESRDTVINIFIKILKEYQTNDTAYNACLVKELIKLNANETLELVQEILNNDKIDYEFISEEEIFKFIDA